MEKQIQEKTSQVIKNEKKDFFSKYFLHSLLFLFLIFGAYNIGYLQGRNSYSSEKDSPFSHILISHKNDEKRDFDFSLFWKTWDILEEKYVDAQELDAKKIMYGAIEGMLESTNDPYTTFFDPEENKEFEEDISGEFDGIGAELEMRNDFLTIVSPLTQSPAEKAGIRPGDIIVAVSGEDITGETLTSSVSKIRGQKGTEVVLTIVREGLGETLDIKIIRDTINVESVVLDLREEIAIIEIRQFGEKTMEDLRRIIKEIERSQAKKIVLDLRNNPGGYLDVAVEVSNMFLEPHSVIVIEEDGKKQRKETFSRRVSETDFLTSLPTVILINRGSASASEIFTGALQFHRKDIVVIGEKSFGKGSVQELVPLPQSTSAKITVARWLTPAGEQIDTKGIEPQIKVEMTEDDYREKRDPQLERALEIIREK
ncbi:MAG: S41 family peptidase [Candidatus Moranbacteria bacterium]|nr:S41 family peptidase [Candidatus Moranbacteria bacterium]